MGEDEQVHLYELHTVEWVDDEPRQVVRQYVNDTELEPQDDDMEGRDDG